MATLTSDEARARGRLLDIERYDIDLDLTRGPDTFGSTTVIAFTAREAGDTFVELRADTLHRAVLDGVELDTGTLTDGRLPLRLDAGEHRLEITADMPYSRTGEGMHRFTDPADGLTYLYTMCCMAEASLVYAAFDQPDLKAVFQVTVTAPEEWTVLANGVTSRVDGEPGRWRSAPTPPISTYLLAVAAGPWHSRRTEHAGLPFGLHVRQSLAPYLDRDTEELFDLTRRVFDRFHELFDEPYPFDSYDQAFVPEFNHGAMENPGLVVFRDQFINRSAATGTERERRGVVIAHEMAHMWFGDLVTLRWWDDIWLNESFAEYLGYQVLTEATDHRPWTEFAASRKSTGYDADQRPSTHPVAPVPGSVHDTAAAWLNFDGISYAKGASALRQLVAWLGEPTFLAGLNEHFARHRFGNASLDDLIASLSHVSGRDVHAWADSWLRTTGPDTLTPEIVEDDGAWHLALHHSGGRPHRLRLGTYDTGDSGRAVLRDHHEVTLAADESTARHTYTGRRPDLVVLNDGDLTYAKTPFDAASWDAARRHLATLPDPLTRAVVWNTARTMVRDGALAPREYLGTVHDQLAHEDDTAVIEGVLRFARATVTDAYLTDSARDDALGVLRDLTRAILDRTDDPGLRLAAARTHIDSATEPAHLLPWWQAGSVPGGPELDPELRWRLLHRLAVLGATGADAIDAEAARDTSASGQEGAARCRAALPDPGHKAAAWDALFGADDRLSAYVFNATAQGFWNPEQRQLLTPYRDRYFAELPALAARRGHILTVSACEHGFPRGFTDETTLRLGEECLTRPDVTQALRRELADQLDGLRRALAVRRAHG